MKEYLPSPRARPKWNQIVKALKSGDVVLVFDQDIPQDRCSGCKSPMWGQDVGKTDPQTCST